MRMMARSESEFLGMFYLLNWLISYLNTIAYLQLLKMYIRFKPASHICPMITYPALLSAS